MRRHGQTENPPPPPQSAMAFRPLALAVLFAGLYVVLCGTYIVFSGRIAAGASATVAELQRLELVKGLVFVVLTGSIYFALGFLLLKRIASQEVRIVQQQTALIQSEARAMTGVFAASVAHDINNVIGIVAGYLELIKEGRPIVSRTEAVAPVEKALGELSTLTNRLLALGRAGNPGEIAVLDLPAVVKKVLRFAPTHTRVRACELNFSLSEPAVIRGNESLIARMLMNLILNAAEAVGGQGRIEVRLEQDAENVVFEVHDDGPGVPEELRGRIFDAFYTTKASGTGLGLLSVKLCAEEHWGSASVSKSDLGGACFRVTIPKRWEERRPV